MLIGYILPGRPMAMMTFKTYGYITMTQALTYAQDQKLAMSVYPDADYSVALTLSRYLKVSPMSIFWGQLIATVWSCFVQVAVVGRPESHLLSSLLTGVEQFYWSMANIQGICNPENTQGFSCPNGQTYFSASMIWGVIGPKRVCFPFNVFDRNSPND
jgi:hypothetical protein